MSSNLFSLKQFLTSQNSGWQLAITQGQSVTMLDKAALIKNVQAARLFIRTKIKNENMQNDPCLVLSGPTSPELISCLLAGISLGYKLTVTGSVASSDFKTSLIPNPLIIQTNELTLFSDPEDEIGEVLDEESHIGFFTSGSTGHPKLIFHSVATIWKKISIHHQLFLDKDPIASPLPLNHVYGLIFVLLSSLFKERRIHLFDRFNPRLISHYIHTKGIRTFAGTPSMLRTLTTLSEDGRLLWSDVHTFYSAGAAIPQDLATDLKAKFQFQIIQLYGTTETIGSVTCLGGQDQKWLHQGKIPSCGNAIPNVHIEIRNVKRENEVGEILVAHRDFNSLSDDSIPMTWISTGDLGYYQEEPKTGKRFFFIVGRIGDSFKRKEEQLTLKEVEDLFEPCLKSIGATVVAVPFQNDWIGFGLSLHIFSGNYSENWKTEFRRFILEDVPTRLRPNIVHLEMSTPLEASTKPSRAVLAAELLQYKSTKFAGVIYLES